MKITVKKWEMVEHEVEIEFPFYGHNFDSLDSAPVSWDIFVKIDEDGNCTAIEIKNDDGDRSYEFTIKAKNLNRALAEYGQYDASTEAEFKAAVKKADEALRRYG